MAEKRILLGISDFQGLIEAGGYFIDKSLLVEEVLEHPQEVLLLPRPRRFGKTLNLSMLECFFDPRHAEEASLFRGLAIEQRPGAMAFRGRHPVVFLSLKDAKGLTWEETLGGIRQAIAATARAHRGLLASEALDEAEKQALARLMHGQAGPEELAGSLRWLAELLHRHHGRRALVLVDEYDAPIQSGHGRYDAQAASFTRQLLGAALKDNPHLFKGVVTGILRVARESIFSGLNNVGVFTVLDQAFSDKFGFTEAEVERLFADMDLRPDMDKVRLWYNGYRFGSTRGIHNPWSVLSLASRGGTDFEPYWVNTGGDALIADEVARRGADGLREDLGRLLEGGTLEKPIEPEFVFDDLRADSDLLWTLLLMAGYLTFRERNAWGQWSLAIPNHEVATSFRSMLARWLRRGPGVSHGQAADAAKALVQGRAEDFQEALRRVMGDTFSYFDQGTEPERAYHAYLLGLLAVAGDSYVVRSNRESGAGRYDVMLLPREKGERGAILEIKTLAPRGRDEEEEAFEARIGKALEKALEQIRRNRYHQELLDHGIPAADISLCAVVFAGKTPFARMDGPGPLRPGARS